MIKNYIGFVNEYIKKVDDEWVVYPKKPKKGSKYRKRLGTHKTKKEALSQLRAIEASKNNKS